MNSSGIVNDYYLWLKNETFYTEVNDNISRISLPFLDHNNDYTEVYIINGLNGDFRISDDGETLNTLELDGVSMTSSRKLIVERILASHGCHMEHNEIFIFANKDNISIKKHMLVQCLLKIGDLYALASSNIKSFFAEDVAEFLDENGIRYTPNPMFIGKSDFPCQFDFVIPKSKRKPERIIKTFNSLDNERAKILMFSWEDTKLTRPIGSNLYALINDSEKIAKKIVTNSLAQYGIKTVEWSHRSDYIEEFAA